MAYVVAAIWTAKEGQEETIFEHYVRGEAIPNLESRERAFYETINV